MHRIDGVHHQVEQHLLQLNPVALDVREIVTELCPHGHPGTLQLAGYEQQQLADGGVQVGRRERRRRPAEDGAQPRDDVRGTTRIANRQQGGVARAVDVW